jgi:hypothetical protein
MSFGEFLISAGFIQKTTKGDLFIKRNQRIIMWHLCGKVLEDSRRLSAEREASHLLVGLAGHTCRPLGLWQWPSPISFYNVPPPSP